MRVKKIIGKMHQWLGLMSGLIVFIVGLTGCLIVFEKEISGLLDYGVYKKVERQELPFAPPSKVFAIADSVLEGKAIGSMYYTIYFKKNNVNILWARDTSRQYHAVLQNPYSAAIAGSYNYKSSFFTIMTFIHTSLAMGEVGSTLIRYATLIFVIMMVTGIILWKPASRNGYKQRFTIKWNASGKRLNYDLHNVLGFYMTWAAIFIALTGLVWSFEWFNNSVQWVANGGKNISTRKEIVVSDTLLSNKTKRQKLSALDRSFETTYKIVPGLYAMTIYKPGKPGDVIRISVQTSQGVNYERTDDYNYDQYSGRLLAVHRFAGLSNGEKLRRINYSVHVGSIGGLATKVLAFFASLIAASLPVSGFIIWRGRNKKNKKALRKL